MSIFSLDQIQPQSCQFEQLPCALKQQGEQHYSRLLDKDDSFAAMNPKQINIIKWQFAMSDFVADAGLKEIDWLKDIVASHGTENELRLHDIVARFSADLANVTDEAGLFKLVRCYRRREMMLIAWRDLNGSASMDESLLHISGLSDILISQSLAWLYQHYCQQWGTPTSYDGEPQPMFVLGMGKLGGEELNFSSDIDLIFCYPESGVTQGGRRELDNQTFFIRLGQKLIAALQQPTVDGSAYRVDMRLRPYGESGPMAMSFAMLEDYYQEQGRDWERYAMLKARIITAPQWQHSADYKALYELFRPFVYRRYIDFSAIDSLRKMKQLISQEVRRKGLRDNIKLGAGGIREIEFVVQAFQLIRGGREDRLRIRSTRKALTQLVQMQEINQADGQILYQAYHFFRKTEHVLQELNDEQTQTLPDTELAKARVYVALGFTDWPSFYQVLTDWMTKVHQVFSGAITEPEDQQTVDIGFDFWIDNLSAEAAIAQLEEACPNTDASAFWQQIIRLKTDLAARKVGPRGREVINRLMPILIDEALSAPDSQLLLTRLSQLLLTISTRTAYLELLLENHSACLQLIKLVSASPWISEQLSKHPILLDELIDPQQLYQLMPEQQYQADLREKLMRIEPEDLELQMEALRQFKHAYQLRIAAADVSGVLPVMKVSDHLTWLAEAILEQVLHVAWYQISDKYGVPTALSESTDKGFAILAYGKAGGLELGYGSDLDLVFVHNQDNNAFTTGNKSISVMQFYLRLAQRIVHIFGALTPSGQLYEIDMRLRPDGNSGVLVCSASGFTNYQLEKAWTWEHQALVRSRAVCGDSDLTQQLEQARCQILGLPREPKQLKVEVREMREKMRQHLAKGDETHFDLKQDAGGIADIEFITQFVVLNYANTYPDLAKYPDNVRILQTASQLQILSDDEASVLIQAYLDYRAKGHKLSLAKHSVITESGVFDEYKQNVKAIWNKYLAD